MPIPTATLERIAAGTAERLAIPDGPQFRTYQIVVAYSGARNSAHTVRELYR